MNPLRFSLALVLLCAATTQAQILPSYDLGGASKPKPDLSFRKENQYKRVHQASLRFILRGELDKTETFLNGFHQAHPDDAETLYMLGILHGQRGNVTRAEDYFKQAVAAGLPDNRIIAGPREIMKPLEATEFYQRLLARYQRELVHGPLVGNVTADTASFWVRTGMEANVVVAVRDAAGNEVGQSKTVRSHREEDFTAVAAVGGLQPSTEYSYTVLLYGVACPAGPTQKFRTFGPRSAPSQFVIAFGGGAGYVPANERMWNTMGDFDPHAILLLGDNVYIDDPESVAMQQYTYQRRQSRPEWRQLTARSPVFTIWDDHDFSTNGYDLYEFNSSRLTNQHVHPTMEKRGAIFSYNKLQSFGLVTFDTTIADPQVTYEVVTINGDKPHSITVKRSELRAK